MSYSFSGDVYVPKEEFWEWAFIRTGSQQVFLEERIRLNLAQQILILDSAHRTYHIPAKEFWSFVAQYHPDFGQARHRYGTPLFDYQDLVIPLSVTTPDVHGYAEPPSPHWQPEPEELHLQPLIAS